MRLLRSKSVSRARSFTRVVGGTIFGDAQEAIGASPKHCVVIARECVAALRDGGHSVPCVAAIEPLTELAADVGILRSALAHCMTAGALLRTSCVAGGSATARVGAAAGANASRSDIAGSSGNASVFVHAPRASQ